MTTTGVVAVAILSVLLGISLLAVFFLLRQVLIWQSNRFRLEMQRSSENKRSIANVYWFESSGRSKFLHNFRCNSRRVALPSVTVLQVKSVSLIWIEVTLIWIEKYFKRNLSYCIHMHVMHIFYTSFLCNLTCG